MDIGQIPLDPSNIATWGLDGDFTDRSGNGKTLTGTPTYSFLENAGGLGGQVCDFTGGYATTAALSNFGATDEFTIGSWVYLDAIPGVGSSFALHSRQDGADRNYELAVENRAGVVTAFFSNNDGPGDLIGSQVLSTGQWYFIVATRTAASSGTNKIYVNGELDVTLTSAGNNGSPTSSSRIAAYTTSGGILNGKLDESFILSREYLAAEIKNKFWEAINYGKYN